MDDLVGEEYHRADRDKYDIAIDANLSELFSMTQLDDNADNIEDAYENDRLSTLLNTKDLVLDSIKLFPSFVSISNIPTDEDLEKTLEKIEQDMKDKLAISERVKGMKNSTVIVRLYTNKLDYIKELQRDIYELIK